jgi:hypothetical protein
MLSWAEPLTVFLSYTFIIPIWTSFIIYAVYFQNQNTAHQLVTAWFKMPLSSVCISTTAFFSFFGFWWLLGFEFSALHLLGQCSTSWAVPPVLNYNFPQQLFVSDFASPHLATVYFPYNCQSDSFWYESNYNLIFSTLSRIINDGKTQNFYNCFQILFISLSLSC